MSSWAQRLALGALWFGAALAAQATQGLYWRNSATGENYQHLFNQAQLLSQNDLPSVAAPWSLVAAGDFDADTETDLFWRNLSTGETALQLMGQGQHRQFRDFIKVADQNWQVVATGDLDGDQLDDLIWRNKNTGEYYLWLLNNQGLKSEQALFKVTDNQWQLAAVADFDADGKADLWFRHATSGENYLFLMDAAKVRTEGAMLTVADVNWRLMAAADLDGDKRADLVWRHQKTGENYAFYMNGSQLIAEQPLATVSDLHWQLAAVTDMNADGKADQLWWNDQTYEVVLWLMDGRGKQAEYSLTKGAANWQLRYARSIKLPLPSYQTEPLPVPGRIEAEFYDRDGAGLAFYDSTAGNSGMALRQDAVDVEACTDQGGGYNLGYIAAGEWLKYSVKVAKTGNYKLIARVAAQDVAGRLHLEQQGTNLTGSITVPVTGGWQQWASVESPVFSLNAGVQSLKLVFDSELFNVNYIELVEAVLPPLASPTALTAQQQNSDILVSWQAVPQATAYMLERRASQDSQWTAILVSGTSYLDKGLSVGQSYQYRVQGQAAGRTATLSNQIDLKLAADAVAGAKLYAGQCASCHGADGSGGLYKQPLNKSCVVCSDFNQLVTVINSTMPKGNADSCDLKCSQDLAAFIQASLVNGGQPQACSASQVPVRSLRLLTRQEYQSTLAELFGLNYSVTQNLPVEPLVRGYDNNAKVSIVTSRHVDEYLSAAAEVANWVITQKKLPMACATGVSASDCAKTLVPALGLRLFRRPLTADESSRYQGLFSDALIQGDSTEGSKLLLQAMLISPQFLYRSELGTVQADGRYRLSPYEVASSLSYLFWGSGPDADLLAAAASGSLATSAGIKTQAQRLLADPRARPQINRFAGMWLGTSGLLSANKDFSIYPKFTGSVRQSMQDELERFVQYVIFEGSGRYPDLLTSKEVFVNQDLASFYGISGSFGSSLTRVSQTGTPTRGGLLSLGAVLASQAHSNESSPIKRGKFVRDRLLCQDLPPPPPDLDTTPPGLDPKLTTRERFARHTSSSSCASCHQYIDSLGFGFEAFDGVGAFRATENSLPVDQSGSILGLEQLTNGVKQSFTGPRQLAELIAQSQTGPACLARQYYRFAMGVAETSQDDCALAQLSRSFSDSGYSIQSLLLALVSQEAFVWRVQE